MPSAEERTARLEAALPALQRWRGADKDAFTITVDGHTYRKRPDASEALVETLRRETALLKGAGMRVSRPIGDVAGHTVEIVRPMSTDSICLQFADLPIPHKEIKLRDLFDSDSVTGGDRSAAARAAYNSGFMKRLESMVTGAEHSLNVGRWQLDRDRARLDELEQVTLSEFPRGRELRDMTDELTALQRELREAETSPEALAAKEALTQRMSERGREDGWSLMLNPTPALVEQLGFETADEVRQMMAAREYQALAEARYRTPPSTHTTTETEVTDQQSCRPTPTVADLVAASQPARLRLVSDRAQPQPMTSGHTQSLDNTIEPNGQGLS